jgi:hypothetical protein
MSMGTLGGRAGADGGLAWDTEVSEKGRVGMAHKRPEGLHGSQTNGRPDDYGCHAVPALGVVIGRAIAPGLGDLSWIVEESP